MVTRRDAVQRIGYAAAGTLGLGAFGCSARAAREGRSDVTATPIGVQLYTVRDAMQESVEATLAQVAEIGYREVEFWRYYGRTPQQVRETLSAIGLDAPAVHVPVQSLTQDWERALTDAATIGHRYLVVASLPEHMRTTLDDWRRTADTFNRAGEAAHDVGLQFAYHNHDLEFAPIDGRVPFDVLCEETNPAFVQIELDLFWIIHGGGDPIAFFERWPGRTPTVHVKDRTRDGQMVDLGAGAIDWPAIFAHRHRAGIRHYFVEHDQPADPFASIAASYRYLSQLELS